MRITKRHLAAITEHQRVHLTQEATPKTDDGEMIDVLAVVKASSLYAKTY